MPIDPRDLRNAFGTFATGVTIVATVEENGTPRGFTANSFTSVSLDPPLVLVCIGKSAASLDVFSKGEGFSVNILGESQKEIASLFATQRPDKFQNVKWHRGEGGMPLLDDVNSWFECRHHNLVDAGDHVILIGEVTNYFYENHPPLGYVNGGFFKLEGGQALLDAAKEHAATIIGAVLEQSGRILLKVNDDNGQITVPNSSILKVAPNPAALSKALAIDDFEPSLEFLLSAYEDKKTGDFLIHYRGSAKGEAPKGFEFFPIDSIPFDKIKDEAVCFMLDRYVTEMDQGRFAIYHGDEKSGETRKVDENIKQVAEQE